MPNKQLWRLSDFLLRTAITSSWLAVLFICAQPPMHAADSRWIHPEKSSDPLLWGRKDGVIFGLPSDGGLPGPRGLIRVGIISPKTGTPELLNYIAIEPVVTGRGSRGDRMAFSELESSELDPGSQGKRLWVGSADSDAKAEVPRSFSMSSDAAPGTKGTVGKPIEKLSVRIEVERFSSNGAHVYLIASIGSDHPDELRLAVYRHEDSPPIEELTVTATMGNYERLRSLWLKNQVIDSRSLYRSYRGDDFAEHGTYSLSKMLRTADGDAIVLCTSNEAVPEANPTFKASDHWRYRLGRLTQYWRVPSSDIQPSLRVRVNGRRVYWASHDSLGGGIAFENFEVREKYKAGQTFTFGVTNKEPWEIAPAIQHLANQRSAESN